MSFFLGFDAGGTKTECVLADASGAVVGRGRGGPANLRRTPPAILAESLRQAFTSALVSAGLQRAELEAACAGMAGASDVEGRQTVRRILLELTGTRLLFVVGDMEVALEAAVGAGRGVVLIAGTGSIAYGRNDCGQQARAGGRGPETSDEGSAVDIGRRALAAVLRAHQGSEFRTALESSVRNFLQLRDASAIASAITQVDNDQLAALLPVVLEAARGGDPVARDILRAAGDALAQLVETVLGILRLEAAPTRIATTGGVFAASPEIAQQVVRRLRERVPHAQVEPLATAPAEGAVRLAQRLWLQQRASLPVGLR